MKNGSLAVCGTEPFIVDTSSPTLLRKGSSAHTLRSGLKSSSRLLPACIYSRAFLVLEGPGKALRRMSAATIARTRHNAVVVHLQYYYQTLRGRGGCIKAHRQQQLRIQAGLVALTPMDCASTLVGLVCRAPRAGGKVIDCHPDLLHPTVREWLVLKSTTRQAYQ